MYITQGAIGFLGSAHSVAAKLPSALASGISGPQIKDLSIQASTQSLLNSGLDVGAQASIPAQVDVSLEILPSPEPKISEQKILREKPEKLWQAQNIDTGRAQIDLDRQYRLTVDEISNSLTIDNFESGQQTIIWGAEPLSIPATPQMQGEEQKPLQFWGTATFVLDNRARITVQTKADPANSNIYIMDTVTVTKNDRALVIKGAGNADAGDMAIQSNKNGWNLDADTPDNFVLKQTADGVGWSRAGHSEPVTQQQLDKTAIGERFGPGKEKISMNDFSKLMSRFISSMVISMASSGLRDHMTMHRISNNAGQDEARDVAKKAAMLDAEKRAMLERNEETHSH